MLCQLSTTWHAFVILAPIRNQEATTIARVLEDRVFSVFGVPEILHFDQGTYRVRKSTCPRVTNSFSVQETRTTPYRPQGNSILERVHSTMHNMLAMHCDVAHDNWSQLLPFVQMAHNTAYSSTINETPHYLMFGRMPTLPNDIIMGNASGRTSRYSFRPFIMLSDSELLILCFDLKKKWTCLCSPILQIRRDKIWFENPMAQVVRFWPKSGDSTHRIIKSKNGIGL